MKQRKWVRFVSVILAAAVLVSLFAIPAFAEKAKTYQNYLPLGDSITAACFFSDYNYQNENRWVSASFPALVKEQLGAENALTGNFQGGKSAWRSCEIRLMLDDSYTNYYQEHATGYLNMIANELSLPENKDILPMRAGYRNAIRNADLITLQFANNDVMTNTFYEMMCYFDACSDHPAYSILSQLIHSLLKQNAANVTEGNQPKIAITGIDFSVCTLRAIFDKATDLGFYDEVLELFITKLDASYRRFCKNWDVIVAKVRELNPNADLVVLGMYNPVSNYLGEIGEIAVTPVVHSVNYYLQYGSAEAVHYTFADLSGFDPKDTCFEGLHPNAAGHQYIADQVMKAIGSIRHCSHTHTYTLFAKKATMFEMGYTGDVFCADCGLQLEQGKITSFVGDIPLPRAMTTITITAVLKVVAAIIRSLNLK